MSPSPQSDHLPMDLHRMFSETPYGQKLEGGTRFGLFQPKDVPNEEWERLLGADVNNLRHLPLSYGLTRRFIQHCQEPSAVWREPVPAAAQFSTEEAHILELTAVIHDWAEAVVGDKMFHLKTEADEDEESAAFKKLLTDLLSGEQADLAQRLGQIVAEVVEDRSTKLGRAFNAIERVGYLRTGLRAWDLHKHTENYELKTHLAWLAYNVTANQTVALVEYAQTYPAVSEFLDENRRRLTDLFTNLSDEATMLDGSKTEILQEKYALAREYFDLRYVTLDRTIPTS